MVSYFLCLQASVLSTMEKLSWHNYTLSNYSVPALALVGDFSFMSSPSLFPLCISCLISSVDAQIMAKSHKVERKTLLKLCNKSLAERLGSNWPKAIWTCVVIVLSEAMFPEEAKQDIREARNTIWEVHVVLIWQHQVESVSPQSGWDHRQVKGKKIV